MSTPVVFASPLGALVSGRPLRLIIGLILLTNGLFPALWILFTSLKLEPESGAAAQSATATAAAAAAAVATAAAAATAAAQRSCAPFEHSGRHYVYVTLLPLPLIAARRKLFRPAPTMCTAAHAATPN